MFQVLLYSTSKWLYQFLNFIHRNRSGSVIAGRGPTVAPPKGGARRAAAGQAHSQLQRAPPPAAPPAIKHQRQVNKIPPPPASHGLRHAAHTGGCGGGGEEGRRRRRWWRRWLGFLLSVAQAGGDARGEAFRSSGNPRRQRIELNPSLVSWGRFNHT
jgi:hypothetical protein